MDLVTLTLLIVIACNLGVLFLYWRIYRWTRSLAEIYSLMWDIRKQLTKFSRETDYDFRAVKTRLSDEERDDQKSKRRARGKSA